MAARGALAGQSIGDSGVRDQLRLILVAVKQRGGHMLFNPPNEARLAAGDTLIIMGRREQLDRAGRLAATPATPATPTAR